MPREGGSIAWEPSGLHSEVTERQESTKGDAPAEKVRKTGLVNVTVLSPHLIETCSVERLGER